MSQYWAGYHGLALVLDTNEFTLFLNNYRKLHTDDTTRALDEQTNDGENPLLDCTIREYPFQPCVGDKEFYVVNVLTEDNDGMCFIPCHRPDGSTNEAVLDENGKYVQSVIVENLRSQDSFVFFTDEDMTSGSYLDGKTKRYDSFQDVLTEFQNKMKDYLPEDFNWDSHIGDFSYACFA